LRGGLPAPCTVPPPFTPVHLPYFRWGRTVLRSRTFAVPFSSVGDVLTQDGFFLPFAKVGGPPRFICSPRAGLAVYVASFVDTPPEGGPCVGWDCGCLPGEMPCIDGFARHYSPWAPLCSCPFGGWTEAHLSQTFVLGGHHPRAFERFSGCNSAVAVLPTPHPGRDLDWMHWKFLLL